MQVLLEATNRKGQTLYYTGRAGADWVSPDKTEAFDGMTLEGAANRALRFNLMTDIHGLTFTARATA